MSHRTTLIVVALAVVCGGCSEDGTADDSASNTGKITKQEVDAKKADVEAIAAEAVSCDVNDDCASLGIGDKPCGGVWTYVPYSTSDPQAATLENAAEELQHLENQYNTEQGVQSDCSTPDLPNVSCIEQECQIE